jgi:hypothetical protein
VEIITSIIYIKINSDRMKLFLYNIYFPSNNKNRKKYGIDKIAAIILTGPFTIFGDNFNDGSGGIEITIIDVKFITAESII